jgi:hypothetical protein
MEMKTWMPGLFVFCGVITAPCAYGDESTPTDTKAVEQVTTRAIEMYQQANSLYLNQQFAEAYELYKAAWSLRPNYKVAGNLGNCEYDLHKYRDAAEHLAFALRENPEQGIAATRTYFAERLADATRYVGTVEVEVDNAAVAELFIGKKHVGNFPETNRIYVEPGSHIISARNRTASDFFPIEIKKGEKKRVVLHVLPPPSKMTPQVETFSLPTFAYMAGAGVSVALISGGIYMNAMQSTSQSALNEISWGTMVGGGAVGLVSLAILLGTSRTKQAPTNVTGMILPVRGNWYVGLRSNF